MDDVVLPVHLKSLGHGGSVLLALARMESAVAPSAAVVHA